MGMIMGSFEKRYSTNCKNNMMISFCYRLFYFFLDNCVALLLALAFHDILHFTAF